MKRILILLLAVMTLVGCAKAVDPSADSATYDESKRFDPLEEALMRMVTESPATEPPSVDELAQAKYDRILSSELDTEFDVIDNVEPLGQLRGMQAGCEALALTAALNHFGYDLDIDDIVDDYLVYGNDFVTGYVGDPHRFYDGAGIYPPGMLTTIWNFIDENGAALYPFDTTGLELDDLYKFIHAGCPVLIWTTYDRSRPYIEQSRVYEGISYPWYDTEHCVCLHGFHLPDDEVKVADSWDYGKDDWEDASRFEDIYDEVGRFSVVLMDISDLK